MRSLLLVLAVFCVAGASSCQKSTDQPKLLQPAGPVVPATPDTCTRPSWSPGNAFRPFSNPCGLALSPDGRVAVSEYNGGYGLTGRVSVYKKLAYLLSGSGNPDFNYPIAKAPEALAFDPNGNLFIAETEATAGVTILKKGNGYGYTFLKTIQGGFVNPRGMAFDAQGRFYLCDDGNNRVLRFDAPLSSGNFTPVITGLGSPKGIAIADSNLYIAEYSANKVSRWKLDSYAAAAESCPVASPVDVAASKCLMVVAQPAAQKVVVFHAKMSKAVGIEYPIGSQVFGLAIDTQSASLLLSAYDKDRVLQYQ